MGINDGFLSRLRPAQVKLRLEQPAEELIGARSGLQRPLQPVCRADALHKPLPAIQIPLAATPSKPYRRITDLQCHLPNRMCEKYPTLSRVRGMRLPVALGSEARLSKKNCGGKMTIANLYFCFAMPVSIQACARVLAKMFQSYCFITNSRPFLPNSAARSGASRS